MAHLPDGILTMPVLAAGAVVAVAGCAAGLRRLPPERIPHAALATTACFLASLVHFPVGAGSVHLLLNGLAGILLGWAAFPAVAVAALLQALTFGFGGFLALGVNIVDMAAPAVAAGALFRAALNRFGPDDRRTVWAAGAAGGLATVATACLMAAALAASGGEFATAAYLALPAHAPVALIETFVAAAAAGVILRTRPEHFAPPRREEA